MSALVLDAGAFGAVDRDDRRVVAMLVVARRAGVDLKTTGIVVAEVWHDARGRQANLARLLPAVDVRPVDERLGREAGVLRARAGGGADAADATVVAVSATGDTVITGDVGDLRRLVDASGRRILIVHA